MALAPSLPPHGLEVVQTCYVVRDLDVACRRFHEVYGIGPFLGGAEVTLDNHVYRGAAAAPVRLRGVFVQSGDLNIELVELLSPGPSAFHDLFPDGQTGLHHVAVFSDDYEATRDRFVAQGMPVASEFIVRFGAQICYIDARETCGHMIELYPENAIIRGMYEQTRQAAVTWDRKDLIIPWE